MRLLHLADVHLDTLFAGRTPELRDRLRAASREAFRRAVSFAIERGVDGVLVAGDLFDGSRLSFATERFLLDELGRLESEGISFFYCTGNHDPGRELVGSGRIPWPGNVELFADGDPRTVTVHRSGKPVGTITSAGHRTSREGDNLSVRFAGLPERRLPAVAMLHTQVLGAGGADSHERYAPSELPFLREAAYDYWALGHIHLRQALSNVPAIHFPGNLQGRSPRETGAKGGLLVELAAPHAAASVEFAEFGPIRWEVLEVGGLASVETLDDLVTTVRRAWEAARDRDPAPPDTEWMVRVRLSGASPLAGALDDEDNRRSLAAEIAGSLDLLEAELHTGGVRSTVDPAELRERQDPAGAALRLVAEIDSAADPAAAAKALMDRIGVRPEDLAGLDASAEAVDPGSYLVRLLGGEVGQQILVDGFVGEGGSS